MGLGPGIQFGSQGTWFRVNGYMETDVRNRPSGIKVTFRISKAPPTAPRSSVGKIPWLFEVRISNGLWEVIAIARLSYFDYRSLTANRSFAVLGGSDLAANPKRS